MIWNDIENQPNFSGMQLFNQLIDISDVTAPAHSMPGGILSISAQGDQDGSGIVWASHPIRDDANQAVVDGMLRAIDAGNLKRVLWDSTSNPADAVGKTVLFGPSHVRIVGVVADAQQIGNDLVHGTRPAG